MKSALFLDSVSYSFDGDGGVMLVEFSESERSDSVVDVLSFGLMTNQRQDAILFRVSSGNSNDFLQVELVGDFDGFFFFIFYADEFVFEIVHFKYFLLNFNVFTCLSKSITFFVEIKNWQYL